MLTGAVIGCGHGGRLSLQALQNSEAYQLIAATDPSIDARQTVETAFPHARLFADFREMLTDCPANVICVATPAPSHASIAREVMLHKPKGLLLEKPLACNVAAAETLLGELRRAAYPVVVPHGMLVLPAAQEIKARIRRGDIGAIRLVEVQNAVDLLNAGIHWVAYLLDVFDGDAPAAVSAEFGIGDRIINDAVQVESRGVTQIHLRSGLRICLNSGVRTKPISNVLPAAEQRGALFRITGSNGVIEFSAWAGSYSIKAGRADAELIKRPLPAGSSYHQIFLEQLAQNIADEETDYTSAELSLAALRLIESAYRQNGDNGWALGAPAH
jgi:predicted dehydrogenase